MEERLRSGDLWPDPILQLNPAFEMGPTITNYVMLELILTRPEEHRFVEAGKADLRFLVLDELHMYPSDSAASLEPPFEDPLPRQRFL